MRGESAVLPLVLVLHFCGVVRECIVFVCALAMEYIDLEASCSDQSCGSSGGEDEGSSLEAFIDDSPVEPGGVVTEAAFQETRRRMFSGERDDEVRPRKKKKRRQPVADASSSQPVEEVADVEAGACSSGGGGAGSPGRDAGTGRLRRFRYWSVTWNNPDSHRPELWEEDLCLPVGALFLVYQAEVGEGSGTLHFQMYLGMKNPCTIVKVVKMFPGCHAEFRRPSHSDMLKYVTKERTRVAGPVYLGSWDIDPSGGQGKRNDLMEVKAAIDAGMGDLELWEKYFVTMTRYYRSMYTYRMERAPPRRDDLEVVVYYGPPGVGKTYYVHDLYADDPSKLYLVSNSVCDNGAGFWFSGYSGQEAVLLDEFYGQIKWNSLLRLLDVYPHRVRVFGGMKNLQAKRIYLTSNACPREWYRYSNVMVYTALLRRVKHIYTRSRIEDEWLDVLPRERQFAEQMYGSVSPCVHRCRAGTYVPVAEGACSEC